MGTGGAMCAGAGGDGRQEGLSLGGAWLKVEGMMLGADREAGRGRLTAWKRFRLGRRRKRQRKLFLQLGRREGGCPPQHRLSSCSHQHSGSRVFLATLARWRAAACGVRALPCSPPTQGQDWPLGKRFKMGCRWLKKKGLL